MFWHTVASNAFLSDLYQNAARFVEAVDISSNV